jgi:hypothetical protein
MSMETAAVWVRQPHESLPLDFTGARHAGVWTTDAIAALSPYEIVAWLTDGGPEVLAARLVQAHAALTALERAGDPRTAALIELLCGDVHAAMFRLADCPGAGWSHHRNPAPVILPMLLVACAGEATLIEGTALESMWRSLLVGVETDFVSPWWTGFDGGERDIPRAVAPPAGRLTRWHLLFARAVSMGDDVWLRPRLLLSVRAAVERRISAELRAGHRELYPALARTAVACAEAHEHAWQTDVAREMLRGLVLAFPRHKAFQRALVDACEASVVLSGAWLDSGGYNG